MQLKQLLVPLAGLALVSVATPSYAYDYKFQPGSACKPAEGTQAGDLLYPLGAIFNQSSSTRSVICPLVRDSALQAVLDVGITVQSNGADYLHCYFFSYDTSGRLLGSPIDKYTGEKTPTKLYFSVPASQTAVDGAYEIRCNLPQNGWVYNTISGENVNTDSN